VAAVVFHPDSTAVRGFPVDNGLDGVNRPARLDDKALIERCKVGSSEAFDELVSRYEKQVYNFAYRISGNHETAWDVSQEAFIRVFNSIRTFRGDANFSTWAYRIVKNVYLDELKKSKSGRTTSLDEYIELDENSVAKQVQDTDPTPDEIVESKDRTRILQEAITSLPEYQRIIVTLYHVRNQSYEQISEILDLPIGTVKSRLNRARLALADMLRPKLELL
jgi:RNA polymerase sigma-70 factor, ECF subfamily